MKRLLIVAFYELKDYLLYIKEKFEEHYFTVDSYPLFRYAYDANDKIPDYTEHMNNYIKETKPDIILWWFTDVPVSVFKFIKQNNSNILFIMYNPDDPMNLNKELFDKAKNFDIIVTPCKETMHMYKLYSNVKTVIFGPMGYDPTLFKPMNDYINDMKNEVEQFSVDISMYFYNLLLDKSCYPNQVVYKKDLIDNVIEYCKKNKKTFRIYGSHVIKEFYPTYYAGEIPYYNMNLLYNFSKINLISSPHSNKSLALSDQIFSVLGSGGLLMIDKIRDIEKIFTDDYDCVVYGSNNYIEKINMVLKNYDKYTNIKNNGYLLSKKYSWDQWIQQIVVEISVALFDKKLYADLYDYDMNDDLLNYWKTHGIKNKEICYNFTIPEAFNAEEYISKAGIKNNEKYAYLHWLLNSKNDIFMKKKTKLSVNFNPANFNIIMEDNYNICALFNKIKQCDTRDIGLLELAKYCDTIPYIKINEILDNYMKSI